MMTLTVLHCAFQLPTWSTPVILQPEIGVNAPHGAVCVLEAKPVAPVVLLPVQVQFEKLDRRSLSVGGTIVSVPAEPAAASTDVVEVQHERVTSRRAGDTCEVELRELVAPTFAYMPMYVLPAIVHGRG